MNNFLEEIGIYFSGTLYIESIIKELIIFKKNPDLIDDFNKGTINAKLISERENYYKKYTFNDKLINELYELYDLDDTAKKLLKTISTIRNILGHGRISVEENTLWHIPYDNKLEEVKEILGLKDDGNWISINKDNLNLEDKKKQFEYIDDILFPDLAKSIGLNYKRIR